MAAKHGDRQVAKTHILGQHGQQSLDDFGAKTVADHHAVDVARIERPRGAFDGERADHADLLADRDRQSRIRAAAAGDQHACLIERIGARQFRQLLAARRQRAHAAQYGAMQRADAERRRQPPHQPLRRGVGGNRKCIRDRRAAVVAAARNDRHEQAAALGPLLAQQIRQRRDARGVRADIGENDRFGLDRSKRGGGVAPGRFDDRKAAGRTQSVDNLGRWAVGNNGERTLQRHGTRIRGLTDNDIVSMPKRC